MATNKKILLLASFLFLASLGLTSCSFFNPGKATKIVLKAEVGSTVDALQRTCTMLKQRLKGMVNDPEAVSDPAQNAITVTFKSNADIGRIKARILASGDLKFYDTYDNADVAKLLMRLDDSLGIELKKDQVDDPPKKAIAVPKEEPIKDSGDIRSYMGRRQPDNEKIRRTEIEEALKKHPLFKVLNPNLGTDFTVAPGPVIGYVAVKDTAMVNKYIRGPLAHSFFPADMQIIYGSPETRVYADTVVDPFTFLPVYALKIIPGESPVEASEHISKAKADINGNVRCVSMDMDKECAARWAAMTTRDTGKYVAIVLGDIVYSCPRVDNPITKGKTEISGAFNLEQAQDLAAVLLCGKLPLKLTIESIETEPDKK